jgi:hypothetical protein
LRLRRPPDDDRNLPGWLYRVARRTARRGLFARLRQVALDLEPAGNGSLAVILDALESGRLLALLTERQRSTTCRTRRTGRRRPPG